jgi:hypothetical protein
MMGLRQNTRRADRQSSCVRMDWSTIGCCLQRLANVLANAPFFLLGSSMGGALVLSLAARLSTEPVNASVLRRAADRWCGCILLCPMLDMALPPRPVLLVLRYLIAALCPLTQFPNFLSPVGNPSKIWKSERVIEWMETYERWGVPGGLTTHRTRGFERNPPVPVVVVTPGGPSLVHVSHPCRSGVERQGPFRHSSVADSADRVCASAIPTCHVPAAYPA